jgi:uncharacterized protein YuzE
MVHETRSIHGNTIRLTPERWQHISQNHPEMAGFLKQTASRELWLDYDKDADVLYINLQRPAVADDSEMTDDGTIFRYLNGKITGYTLLNASMHTSVM